MKLYILNSPICTDFGKYLFSPLSLEEARSWVRDKTIVSAVSHKATAEILSLLLGVEIPQNPQQIRQGPGESALVFRLKSRLAEGTVLKTVQEVESVGYELCLLERLS
jgi:hypothetical protein